MFDFSASIPTWAWAVLNGAWIVSLIAWLCWRSGSPHILITRVWRVVHGRTHSAAAADAVWLNERTALMQFRVVTGVRCRTFGDMQRLVRWSREHNEEVGDIARCGSYFDLAQPGLSKVAPKPEVIIAGFLFCTFAAVCLVSAVSMAVPRAMVKVKQEGASSLLLSPDDVRVWHSDKHFGSAECKAMAPSALASEVGLTVPEVFVVCGWFADTDMPAKVGRTLRDQRVALATLGLLMLFYVAITRGWFRSSLASRSMSDRQTAFALKRETKKPRQQRRKRARTPPSSTDEAA